MTEFTSEFIAEQKEIFSGEEIDSLMMTEALEHYPEALDHIEKQAKRIEELEIKQHIQWDANMMLTMADNSKGYIDLIIELQTKLKELEKELNCYKEK